MPKVDPRVYYPCVSCNRWIPYYSWEVHISESGCQISSGCKLAHPYISDSTLVAETVIIGNLQDFDLTNLWTPKSNNTNSKSVEDKDNLVPEWLRKIYPSFQYRIVLMNESDLIRCQVTAYTPVEIRYEQWNCAFLAIPDEGVVIGHVLLHWKALSQYFPTVVNKSLIEVRKIDKVEIAQDVTLVPENPIQEKDCETLQHILLKMLLCSCPLGAPFTFTHGSRIVVNGLRESTTSLIVSNITSDLCDDLSSVDRSSHLESSQMVIIDECCTSLESYISSSLANDVSKLSLSEVNFSEVSTSKSPKKGHVEAIGKDLFTSTPKKMSNKTNSYHWQLYGSNYTPSQEPLISLNELQIPKQSRWYRTDMNTKIIVAGSLQMELVKNIRSERYCKDNVYDELFKIVANRLETRSQVKNPHLGGWGGILLHGPTGTGKTMLVSQLADEMKISLFRLMSADVVRGSSIDIRVRIGDMFKCALRNGPSIIFIDDIESLCPYMTTKNQGTDITSIICQNIQDLCVRNCDVVVIAATNRLEMVAPRLRQSSLLGKAVLVPLPNTEQRAKIMSCLLSGNQQRLNEDEIRTVADRAYGFSGADLSVLIKNAWVRRVGKWKMKEKVQEDGGNCQVTLQLEDLVDAVQDVVPTIFRQNYTAVSLKMIHRHLENPTVHPLKGLLLFGPPGCSKTLFVRALVHETGFSFFPLKCSNLLSKYVGETEKSLNLTFTQARQASPSIIFMDEVDSLCADRSHGDNLVSELLTLMAGASRAGNVMVIGATNRPHILDEALLRPDCLELVIHIDLPDCTSRCAMWRGLLKDVPINGEIDFEKLCTLTEGYSGAEISAIYQVAAQNILSDLEESRADENNVAISQDILLKAISIVSPRTPESLLHEIQLFTIARKNMQLA